MPSNLVQSRNLGWDVLGMWVWATPDIIGLTTYLKNLVSQGKGPLRSYSTCVMEVVTTPSYNWDIVLCVRSVSTSGRPNLV